MPLQQEPRKDYTLFLVTKEGVTYFYPYQLKSLVNYKTSGAGMSENKMQLVTVL